VLEQDRTHRNRSSADVVEVDVGGVPVLAFAPLVGRVATCLVMPGIDRRVDVSVSPRTAVLSVHQAAAQRAVPLTQVTATTRRSLDAAVAIARAWAPRQVLGDDDLAARLGGAAFPLLGAAYDEGAGAIGEVPRWAAPILAAATVRDGARLAFGSAATRPVVAALARSLTRDGNGPVDLSRLAIALMASAALEPDRLARVLTMDGRPWPAHLLPPPHLLDDGRNVAARWGAAHTERYLSESCAMDDGITVLVNCIHYATDLGAHGPGRLPTHLSELHDLYRSRFSTRPTAPETGWHPPATMARPDEGALAPADAPRGHGRTAHPRETYGLRLAPQVSGHVHAMPQDRIPHPAWLRAIDGSSFDGFRIVLPGACGDLASWSRVLHNCLDSYDRAAMAGQSHLIGIEHRDRLRYVVEVTPRHRIRQFAGQANRLPSAADHDRIVAFLTEHQIVC
jgi:hypothetical protein